MKKVLLKTMAGVLAITVLSVSSLKSGNVQTVQAAASFAKGADVSWLPQMEATGYKFYNDSGTQQDCLQILKDHGINSIRIRTWVNPSNDSVNGHCSKTETVALAKRASQMGFRIMLDFHYSDSWCDPGQQNKPAAWKSHTFSQLLTDVYDYTYDVMNTLKSNGVTPEWVQVGNEINPGMLLPDGSSNNFSQLSQLINKGYSAVKAVSSSSKVIIHIAEGQDNSMFRWFFDGLKNNGANYDIIGMSYYPYWIGSDYTVTINNMASNLNDMVSRYNKPVMVCEVGGLDTNPTNTYNMLVAVMNKVQAVPNSNGLGVFYWEPEGAKSFSGYALSAWGSNGRPTTALDAFLQGSSATPTPTPVPSSGTNLLTNPGFENSLTGWTIWSNGNNAAAYTESGGYSGSKRLTHWANSAYQVSTYQIVTGLANGTYTMTAWVQSSGGQKTCQIYAKNYGGSEKVCALPTSSTWKQITITGISVTNGQCEVGLWSDANSGNYCSMDDVVFSKN